jgi:NTE family protein
MRQHIFFWLLFAPLFGFTQQKVENLVFEGAGIRGIAYAGVVQELEQQNILPQVKKVGGTSAGAIVALLISLNYTAAEIEAIIGSTNFKRFNDGRFLFAGGINRMNRYFGWYRGNRFERWLEGLIKAKTGNGNISFEDLRNKGFKELYVTGTNLNKQQLIVFSYHTSPHIKVKEAVRISMSIPLYFEPLYMTKSGVVVRRPKNKKEVDVLLDGGFIANYPIFLFDEVREKRNPNFNTIGFRIDTEAQIKRDSTRDGLAPMEVTNLPQYVTAFYTLIIESLNRQTLTPEDWQRTVSISDGAIGPRIRKLKKAEIELLVKNGRKATAAYLKKD